MRCIVTFNERWSLPSATIPPVPQTHSNGTTDPKTVLKAGGAGLGTFGGVFTPSILTILGVIMYLRFGWVVGNVGLVGTLIIVTLSTSITLLTALSIAEIATDQRVRAGGAYYMISRSLGVETGGAVGIPLFVAQALSVALYTVGFAESVVLVFPSLDQRIVGIVTTLLIAALALKSARTAIKAQYFIMAAIALSLLSLFFGSPIEQTSVEMWGVPARSSASFWVVFAVFFPAVTGIMAGVNMSGDLRDPSRAIPRGTLMAVGAGYIIYMVLPIILASRADAATLVEEPLIMRRIAFWGDAIILGVWGATLSSALGSILGAPRVLQALARDGVLPRSLSWMGKGHGQADEPRNGTLFTLAIALLAVSFATLDIIAPVLTMFFLTTYGVLNIAAGIERFLRSPSFRPTFRVHWSFSILGAIGCIAVMFLINAVATIIAAVFVLIIYLVLERREMKTAWGDVRHGIWMAALRISLLRLNTPADPKNWRPQLLVLSGAPTRRWHLIELANALGHSRGMLTVATVLPRESMTEERVLSMQSTIRDYLEARGVQSLVRVVAAEDTFAGADMLVRHYGLGNVVPNTILLGDTEKPEHRAAYCRMVTGFHNARRNVLILQDDMEMRFGEKQRIDVWWGGLNLNGGLMMILAYLLQTSHQWREARVVLKMVVSSESAVEAAAENLASIVKTARTGAEFEIIPARDRAFIDILRESSADADLIFMGLARPQADFELYYQALRQQSAGMPPTLYVLAAEDLAFGEVLINSNER